MTSRIIVFMLAFVSLVPAAWIVADTGFSLSFTQYFSDSKRTMVLVATLALMFLLCYLVISRLLTDEKDKNASDS